MKGYRNCDRYCTVLPGAKYLEDAVKVDSVLWWGEISACNQKKGPALHEGDNC